MKEKSKVKKKTVKKVRKESPTNEVGARNPYAMVEHALGVKVDWVATPLENRKKIIEKILKTPYKKIFNPKYESQVYTVVRPARRRQQS